MPVVAGGSVVTGDGHDVDGRDPVTGSVLWSYARDLDLCGVTWVYHYAVAVYPDSRGCGQVSTIDGQTGMRGPDPHRLRRPARSRCPPTAPRCCRPATAGSSSGAPTWSG